MAAYLTGKKLGTRQWYDTRNRALTGCTVIHDAENVMDTVGPDTGAENVAEFIRTRTTAGSYHDLVDSDSGIHLVEYRHGAFHDGTGSNNWALSISFACRTVDWRAMSPAKWAGFLRQGALRFVAQQQWRKANRAPLTRLRYITKAQSDAGESGFCCHGWRDPARRTDPGTKAPNLFPFDEFLAACRVALAQHMPDHPDAGHASPTAPIERDWFDMASKEDLVAVLRSEGVSGGGDYAGQVLRLLTDPIPSAIDPAVKIPLRDMLALIDAHTFRLAALAGQGTPADVDEEALAAALAPLLVRATSNLSRADLDAVAKAVADEQARRLAA